ncbi:MULTISPECIES: ABC transporter substrate-binding protein [unclassified Achromobacter]|uniref:ABC transporter substrate-binding protein n=1 Tax=unclassified Achromobacter TaxID=2626865 RepID=UPI000B51BD98|nr:MULTISPECIES: ABC transporter substrate-binding protein [unclassified Achromobacter]OWT75577.1 ABC transporter substrate-binding protein [Achromobacter sp. HZ28]OWT76238.1 ABC transporter substrate-binding protein [Achromobacter sp. HZ34]
MIFTYKKLLAAAVLAASLPAAHAADIKLGVAEALSGGAAQYGVAIRNGFQLAAEEINAAGGINGNKLALVIEDEQGKKEEAINVFKKLIFQDKVLMTFGPTLSNSAQAADPVAQAGKTVAFGTSNTADGITSIGNYVFRNSVTEADVLPATLKMAMDKAGVKKVAVLYGNDDVFTKSGYDNFKKALDDLKVPVTTTETFAKGDVDFKAQLTKIKGTNPDAIVLSALLAEGGPIMVQARQIGLNVPFIGGNGMNSVKIFDLAPGAASNDLWIGSPWSIENPAAENTKFIAAYKAKYNAAPDQFAAQAYDAMHIVAEALKKTKLSGDLTADRAALREALPGVTWTGATGAFKFRQAKDRAGKPAGYDAEQAPIVSVTKDGKYVIVK